VIFKRIENCHHFYFIIQEEEHHAQDVLPEKLVIEDGSSIFVFNSLPYPREEVICIHTNTWKSRVMADRKADAGGGEHMMG